MTTTVLSSVPYGDHERRRMDVYFPAVPQTDSGMILFIHGGWTDGDKSLHEGDARYWSERGYLCALINYRFVSDTVHIADELDDVADALAAAKRIGASRGFRLQNVLLSGVSAGAHLALLYALTRQDSAPLRPAAVFAYCPPTDCAAPDFLIGLSGEFEDWKYKVLSDCCGITITKQTFRTKGVQAALAAVSPVSYIENASFPVAICHGRQDAIVPYRQSAAFMALLEAKHVPHDLIAYERSGHALDCDPDADRKAKARMQTYLERYLAGRQVSYRKG